MPNILHFSCKPLSDVSIIGLSDLYFNATEINILSGDRLSKSSDNNDVSANSYFISHVFFYYLFDLLDKRTQS